MGIGGAVGGGGGLTIGGSVGLGVGIMTSGGSGVEGDEDNGLMGSPEGKTGVPVTGVGTVVVSMDSAIHLSVGSPVVPAGQVQTGRCSVIRQSASSPQIPKLHTS